MPRKNSKVRFIAVLVVLIFSQFVYVSPSKAATVTAGGAHSTPSRCDQTVSDATNVVASRLASGDCVLTFNSGSVDWTAPEGLTTAQILLVGGGAGGGGSFDTRGAGGGGAGQVIYDSSFNINGTSTYTISVAAKGAGGVQTSRTNGPENVGSNGGNSTLSLSGNTLSIAYGGLGGCASRTTLYEAYCTSPSYSGTGGAAATSTSGGGRGGAGGGGGGGSSGAGVAGVGGAGGAGTAVSITGSSVTYGVGGVAGVSTLTSTGTSASANTGNGGGGASANGANNRNGGDGGSGVVVIRFSPDFVPAAPTLVSVTAGDKQLTVSFTANFAGSASISDYEYSLNSGSYISAGTTASPITITGLNGRATYSVILKARNSVGLSNASSSLSTTTTDASLDASEAAAAEAARAAAEAARAKAAKQQKELTEIFSLIPNLGKLVDSLNKLSGGFVPEKQICRKGKKIKKVSILSTCPNGYKTK